MNIDHIILEGHTEDMAPGGELEIVLQEDSSVLLMDLYLPEVLAGKDADEITSEKLHEKLLEIDGEGSGLDADTVDGKHARDLFVKDPLLAGRVVVGAADGGPGDGGNYEEFTAAFLARLPEDLR